MGRSISHQGSILYYDVLGTGRKAAILFHGFAQDRSIFASFSPKVLHQYTIYSVDLFFHGNSHWIHGELPLEKSTWKDMLLSLLEHEKIQRFSVGGFSIGSRLALATFEALPERIERLILIAPDAVVSNFWYKLATSTQLSRLFFKSTIVNHDRFVKLLRLFQRAGFIGKTLGKFAGRQMDTQAKRKQVYYTWVVLRKLNFSLDMLAQMINDHPSKVRIILGKFDRVITLHAMQNFLKRLKSPDVIIMESGHIGLVNSDLDIIFSDDKMDA